MHYHPSVLVMGVFTFRAKRAHTPNLKAWEDAAPSAFLDIAINRAIISNIVVSKEDGLTRSQVWLLNEWNGVFDSMSDPVVRLSRS